MCHEIHAEIISVDLIVYAERRFKGLQVLMQLTGHDTLAVVVQPHRVDEASGYL